MVWPHAQRSAGLFTSSSRAHCAPAYRMVPRMRAFWAHAGNAPGGVYIVNHANCLSTRASAQFTQGG